MLYDFKSFICVTSGTFLKVYWENFQSSLTLGLWAWWWMWEASGFLFLSLPLSIKILIFIWEKWKGVSDALYGYGEKGSADTDIEERGDKSNWEGK